MRALRFHVTAQDASARSGHLELTHGSVATPAFMPVATYGAVRGLSVDALRGIGTQILLANTYHLHERPGEDVVEGLGGLHGFTGWQGPWLTDSGGFQITSLSKHARIDEDGVEFRSTRDGQTRRLTPESVVAIQEALGSDIAMVLDECRPLSWLGSDLDDPASEARTRAVLERTLRWAKRAQAARRRQDQACFAIVQGGIFPALRRESADASAALAFEGYAHGGLGLGEEAARRQDLIVAAQAALPTNRPQYLMGIGRPEDLLDAIEVGIDLFDCVLPTRNGRHGLVFTSTGPLRLRNARYRKDPEPIEADCDCPACRGHSRAYLRHLLQESEMLGAQLCALHNLRFYMRLLEQVRTAIDLGGLEGFLREARGRLVQSAQDAAQSPA